MNIKRIYLLLVTILLTVSILAGCSGGASNRKLVERASQTTDSSIQNESISYDGDVSMTMDDTAEAEYILGSDKMSSTITFEEEMPAYENDETYSEIFENDFVLAEDEDTSTFSIDVDTAAYANVRNLLQAGILPEKDSIRIEEMINYFDYDYEEPEGDQPFNIITKMADCPWNEDNKVAMIGLKGEEIPQNLLPPSNIVLLVDVSGSMQDYNKLPLLKEAFGKLVMNLTEKDRVSLVVYAGAAGVVLEGAEGADDDKIINALNQLEAGGSTAGGEGIELAYNIANKYFIRGGNNRVVLATDGDFNVGMSDIDDLEDYIEEKREENIFLSVVGFGRGNIRDDVMETLADKGNGNYAYIDSITEAEKVFSKELTGTLFAIAKDVKIQVEFNEDVVESYRLIGYENRVMDNKDFEDDRKDAGELGVGHEVTALYEIELKDHINSSNENVFEVRLRYKEPDKNTSEEIVVTSNNRNFMTNINSDLDLLWALTVAEFGLIIRDSDFKGDASIETVKEYARYCISKDWDEYREGFMSLITDYEYIQNKNYGMDD